MGAALGQAGEPELEVLALVELGGVDGAGVILGEDVGGDLEADLADALVKLVPAASTAELRRLEARVDVLRKEGATVLWGLGLALREVQDRELWSVGGYSSFTAWLEERAALALRLCARWGKA